MADRGWSRVADSLKRSVLAFSQIVNLLVSNNQTNISTVVYAQNYFCHLATTLCRIIRRGYLV